MLKRNHANEYHQMPPFIEGKSDSRQNNFNFESARETLTKEDDKLVVKRRFERINNLMECKSYIQNKDISENKEMFVY